MTADDVARANEWADACAAEGDRQSLGGLTMELRDMVVGRLYRVNAGAWGGLYRYGGCAGMDSALMRRENEPDVRVRLNQVQREATEEEYATDRMRAEGFQAWQAKEQTAPHPAMIVDQGTAATVLCERIKAAMTTVMHLTHQQEKGVILADKMITLLDAAQGFLLRQFREDEPC